jgi:hypothetical protein
MCYNKRKNNRAMPGGREIMSKKSVEQEIDEKGDN